MISQTMSDTLGIVLVDAAANNIGMLVDSNTPAVSLPVANKPIIQYILEMLARSGINRVFLAGSDSEGMQYLSSWCKTHYQGPCSVDIICEPSCEKAPVNLIRSILSISRECENIVIIGSYIISDMSLKAQLMYHNIKQAALTMLVREGDHAETATEYLAIQSDDVVSIYCHAQDRMRDIKIPEACLSKYVQLIVQQDTSDMNVYIFRRRVLVSILFPDKNLGLLDIQKHLIPYYVRRQLVSSNQAGNSMSTLDRTSSTNLTGKVGSQGSSCITLHPCFGEKKHAQAQAVLAYHAPDGIYCKYINSAHLYASINKDVLSPEHSGKFIDSKSTGRGDSHVADGVSIGNKATVGSGSIIGSMTSIGDRTSVKRSVVGASCLIGSNTKIINSILHDKVQLGDGCHIQNTIICRNARVVSKVSMKDCQVGPGISITDVTTNYKSEEFFD
jgi:translation initiation factor eIF-2B subunit gamma